MSDRKSAGERIIKGIPVSGGIGIGPVFVFAETFPLDAPAYVVGAEAIPAEVERLRRAMVAVRRDLDQMRQDTALKVGEVDARIFLVHLQILDDPAFLPQIERAIREDRINAEAAVSTVVNRYGDALAKLQGGIARDRATDVRDVGRLVLRGLASRDSGPAADPEPGTKYILVTHELYPSDAAHLHKERLAAIITETGGKASHAAILARALGIPAVTGVSDFSEVLTRGGVTAIVDGREGVIVIDPAPETVERFQRRAAMLGKLRVSLESAPALPAVTRDGTHVDILLNVENVGDVLPDELGDLAGIGLYRTEFVFMERPFFPSEDEQYDVYRQVVERAKGREVVFRTIDIGGDKTLPYFRVGDEDNPALGWRGFRISDEWPDLFIAQIRALLRASAHGPIKIMLPMVTLVEEIRRAYALQKDVRADLERRGTPVAPHVPLGVMIEVPAAAMAIDAMLKEVDFVSIGSNDLIQYLMAVDRNNARVSHLYQPLNPSVLRTIASIIGAANRAKKEVSLCGEMAGNYFCTLALLGMGLRRFSMARHYVVGVGRLIQSVTLKDAQATTRRILTFATTNEVKAFLHARTREIFRSSGILLEESDLP